MTVDPLALGVVISVCGWDPTELVTDRTVLLNGDGTRLLTLPSLNVTDVSAVSVTLRDSSVLGLTVGPGATDVSWSEDGTLTLKDCGCRIGCFPVDQRNVSVTYSGGYPPDSQDALHLQAVMDSIAKGVGTGRVKSKRMGKQQIEYYPQGLTTAETLVLNRYRIVRAN